MSLSYCKIIVILLVLLCHCSHIFAYQLKSLSRLRSPNIRFQQIKSLTKYDNKFMPLQARTIPNQDFLLDKPILPKYNSKVSVGFSLVAILLASRFLINYIPVEYSDKLLAKLWDKPLLQDLFSKLSHYHKLFWDKIHSIQNFKKKKETYSPLRDWISCTVKSRMPYSEGYAKLVLEGEPMDIEIGRELLLCFTDSEGRVWQRPAYPMHSKSDRDGHFSILIRIANDNSDELNAALDAMKRVNAGDEIAVRAGNMLLKQTSFVQSPFNKELPSVETIVVYCASTGVAAVTQILDDISRSKETPNLSLYWDASPTLCLEELEQLSNKLGNRLKIVQLMPNSDPVGSDIPWYSPGTLAIIAGPKGFADKISEKLREKKFHDAHFVQIITTPIL